jgi:hypothetical protein
MSVIAAADARRLEDAFLGGLNDAQNAYEQIVELKAWTALGFESFTDWWESRVRPVMTALSMRPTREIATSVVDRVRLEEEALPPAQRRTQRELADMVGVDRSALANRDGSRSLPRENTPGTDLEEPASDPIPAPIASEIDRRIAGRVAAQAETAPPGPPAAASGLFPEPAPAHLDDTPEVVDEEAKRRSSQAFAQSLASLWLVLDPDPVRWIKSRWRPDVYPQRDLPRVRDVFTTTGLRSLAKHIDSIADHLDRTGGTL